MFTLGRINRTAMMRPGTIVMGKHKRQVDKKALLIQIAAPPQFLSSEMLQKHM